MTALLPAPPGPPAPVPSPPARRRPVPTVRDGRLVGGIALVLLSVVLGARVVSVAARTTPVLAVRADLPAGHRLVDADLTLREVHLEGGPGAYLEADQRARVRGRTLIEPVSAGQLLPRGALGPGAGPDTAVVPVVVDDGHEPGLSAGDLVDVWSTFPGAGEDARCVTVVVARGLEVVAALSTDAAARGVSVRVPADEVGAVVHAAATTMLVLTRHGAAAGEVPAAVTQVDGITPGGRCGAAGP